MDNIKLLQQIGLSELEAKTYLILINYNGLSAWEIAKKINLQRSTVYYIITSLQKKGLVAESLKNKRKLFVANNPVILEEQAKETYKRIKEAIPEITENIPKEDEEEVLFFKGYKGIKSVYEEMLKEAKQGDEFLILGARGGEDISIETYRNFYKNYNNRRIKKKISQRIIMNSNLKNVIGNYYEKLHLTKVRYINQKTTAPIVIFPNAVAIIHWKKEPIMYLLKGKSIKESFKHYFDNIWDSNSIKKFNS